MYLPTYAKYRDIGAAMKSLKLLAGSIALLFLTAGGAYASEASLAIPDLHAGKFAIFGVEVTAWNLLFYGAFVICGTLGISLYLRTQIRQLPAHKSMLDVADTIYTTCKTYLLQQGKFLLMLFVLISLAITYYLVGFGGADEYLFNNRTAQELRLYPEADKRIPEDVLGRLDELAKADEGRGDRK